MWTLGVNESKEIQDKASWNENRTSYPYYAAQMIQYMHPQTRENSIISIARGIDNKNNDNRLIN
jgi:hypothetical protein